MSHVLSGLAPQQARMQFPPQAQQQPQPQQQHLVVGPPGPSPNSTSSTPQGPPGSMVTVSGPGLSPYGQPISQVSTNTRWCEMREMYKECYFWLSQDRPVTTVTGLRLTT